MDLPIADLLGILFFLAAANIIGRAIYDFVMGKTSRLLETGMKKKTVSETVEELQALGFVVTHIYEIRPPRERPEGDANK